MVSSREAAGCRRSRDGTSLGPKPDSLHQRYLDLYGKFADAWRVTDAHEPFRLRARHLNRDLHAREWPRENPQSCAIEDNRRLAPRSIWASLRRQCSAIADANMKADCVFDVSVTGLTGFAQTYQLTQQRQPGCDQDQREGRQGSLPTRRERGRSLRPWRRKCQEAGAHLRGPYSSSLTAAKSAARSRSTPAATRSGARRAYRSASTRSWLEYTPNAAGEPLLASISPEESHTVIAASNLYLWLVILLLVIILIVFIIWRYLRT